eukprot:GHVT01045779.1.p2 GENE.GHVT01045779.1~~GHVT01045779.1.p2  ORF type:complete len:140 (+),score=15.83 GHVT01045779.1:670-1089(+)
MRTRAGAVVAGVIATHPKAAAAAAVNLLQLRHSCSSLAAATAGVFSLVPFCREASSGNEFTVCVQVCFPHDPLLESSEIPVVWPTSQLPSSFSIRKSRGHCKYFLLSRAASVRPGNVLQCRACLVSRHFALRPNSKIPR